MSRVSRRSATVDHRRVAGWARQALLTGGAVLGGLCLLTAFASVLLGVRPLVFESGSMSPTIRTGALAVSRDVPAADLHVGDVVSVPTASGSRVTHRIVAVQRDGAEAVLRLRGDANTATDAAPYRVRDADRVLFDVPRLGYVVAWLSGPTGLFLLGLYAAFLVSVLLEPQRADPVVRRLSSEEQVVTPSARKRGGGGATGLKVGGGALVLVVVGTTAGAGVLVARSTTPTQAAWTDPGTVSGTVLTARVATPGSFTCGSGGGNKTLFSWSAVSGAAYVLHTGTNGGTPVQVAAGTTSYTLNNSTGTAWVVATQTFGGQSWTSADSPHFSYSQGTCTPA